MWQARMGRIAIGATIGHACRTLEFRWKAFSRELITGTCVQAAAAVWDNNQRHLLDPDRQPKYKMPFLEQDEH